MEFQNQVIRSLRNDLVRLQGLTGTSRSQLVDRVCAAFGFRDARGRWQRMTCLKALTVLEAEGLVSLPPRRGVRRRHWRVADPVTLPHGVPDAVGAIEDLKLVLVTDAWQRAIWDGLMTHEHPRGAGPFVGCQIRYLVGSAHGWLGAVGFSASARRLACRDRWIGWDDDRRRACPGLVPFPDPARGVVPQSRLAYVEPGGRRGGGRFRGAHRPYLLETFVDEKKHMGASFRAANWQHVGKTSGRGRRGHAAEAPKADVRTGCGMAGASAGSRTASCAAGGRGRSGPGELGGTGVRRRTIGGCTPERAPGDLRSAPGGSADAGVHGRCARRSNFDKGLLPSDRQAGRRRSHGGKHPAPASDAAADAGGEDSAVRTAVR